jgi:hypothetical protein
MIFFLGIRIVDEIISYKMCAVKVGNAKLRNYLNKLTGKYLSCSKNVITDQYCMHNLGIFMKYAKFIRNT